MTESSQSLTHTDVFDDYLARWGLVPDGEPVVTHTSSLLPVLQGDTPAMLKIARESEECWGSLLMVWWNGEGAVRVLAHEGDALLMERAMGKESLEEMAHNGRDDQASRIVCAVAEKLHAPRKQPPPELIPLARWFEELEPAALRYGGVLSHAHATAQQLLQEPRDIVVLHGDLHHGNILDGGDRGWLAIDPKRLIGERGFEFANVFCNPDLESSTAPGRLTRQATVVAGAAHLERDRLLKWVLAYSGLSAAWTLGDGKNPEIALAVAEIAASELGIVR